MSDRHSQQHDRSVGWPIAWARLGLLVAVASGFGGTATAALVAYAADAGAWDETLLLLAAAGAAMVATLAVAVHTNAVRAADPP